MKKDEDKNLIIANQNMVDFLWNAYCRHEYGNKADLSSGFVRLFPSPSVAITPVPSVIIEAKTLSAFLFESIPMSSIDKYICPVGTNVQTMAKHFGFDSSSKGCMTSFAGYEHLVAYSWIKSSNRLISELGTLLSNMKQGIVENNYLNDSSESEFHKATTIPNNFDIDTRVCGGLNKIYYGAPGCGKSHIIKAMLDDVGVAKENKIRTTFHPEYSNSDFIGQILPTVELADDGTEKVKYIFNPGPFTVALEKAYNTADMVYLIVEEINRGNAAALFGDMFQLLDRVKDSNSIVFGESEYYVCNPNMQKYLREKTTASDVVYKLKEGVFIPSNLTILATMNTSDQNVFTLDTAFKRRWAFEQISNDIVKDNDHEYKNWFVPGTNVTWERFLVAINNKILEYKIHNQTNEDKRLGKYFVTKDCLTEKVTGITGVQDVAKSFAYKVLEYIWNDVCKIGREEWFDTESFRTLEDLIEAFIEPTNGDPLSVFQNISFEI